MTGETLKNEKRVFIYLLCTRILITFYYILFFVHIYYILYIFIVKARMIEITCLTSDN